MDEKSQTVQAARADGQGAPFQGGGRLCHSSQAELAHGRRSSPTTSSSPSSPLMSTPAAVTLASWNLLMLFLSR